MSLVNDMLRDLDERKRDSTAGYRAVPKKASKIWRWIWVVLTIFLLGIVLFLMARELSTNTNPRSDMLAWFSKVQDTNVVVGTRAENSIINSAITPSMNSSIKSMAEESKGALVSGNIEILQTDNNSDALVVKAHSPVNSISVINWTSQAPHRGHLTFWLDQVTPFVVYEKSATTLDIGIAETRIIAELPDIDSTLLSTLEIIPEEGNSRFKLVTNAPVQFTVKLKQNPARLKIEIAASEVIRSESSEGTENSDVAIIETAAITSGGSQAQVLVVPPVDNKVDNSAATAVVNTRQAAGTRNAVQSSGHWKKSLNTLPTDSSTVRSARRLLNEQHTDEALSLLQQFVNQTPSSLQSRYLLVQLYLATEQYEVAAETLQKSPNNLSWTLLKARALLQQGQAREAIQLLERLPDGQSRQDYLDLLASGYQQVGQHTEAVSRYLDLLALNPQEARWWINMGVSLEHLDQRTKALDAYRNALQIPNIDTPLKLYALQQSQRLMQPLK
ncbi:tetratricopeptide repeat protein [Neptunomonas antarctica]|uniref:Tetratricopeptide repeat-containing protein n=1 Tax=Neptunomonas antarctica TaxID=619304 RepID=A0A1N7MN29_9GAMM|nr:tetratricopeptide repeat protein [Neptunomonas antarctica]SIS87507.1 Tetratricopeptide repeat-containing protein [Neptunomonas antarctica]